MKRNNLSEVWHDRWCWGTLNIPGTSLSHLAAFCLVCSHRSCLVQNDLIVIPWAAIWRQSVGGSLQGVFTQVPRQYAAKDDTTGVDPRAHSVPAKDVEDGFSKHAECIWMFNFLLKVYPAKLKHQAKKPTNKGR